MSQQSAVPAHLDASKLSENTDNSAMDPGFELLKQHRPTRAGGNDNTIYWYANCDSTLSSGPVPSVEIRKKIESGEIGSKSLVWCDGMQKWERLADHFEIPEAASIAPEFQLPPPLHRGLRSPMPSDIFNVIGNWQPSGPHVYCLARITVVLGLLIFLLSFLLTPFGFSWSSEALQIVLLGVTLELTGTVRSAFLKSDSIRKDFAACNSVRDQTQSAREGNLR